jgi:ZIP family zinc transporter
VLGAAIAWFVDVPQRVISAVMSFGAGVLISALSFELMDEAWRHGGLAATRDCQRRRAPERESLRR